MSLVLNELSVCQKFESVYDAKNSYMTLVDIVRSLKNDYGVPIKSIVSCLDNVDFEVTDGINFIQFLNKSLDKEYRGIVLSIINNLPHLEIRYTKKLNVDGVEAVGATYAYEAEGVLISLKSLPIFFDDYVLCDIDGYSDVVSVRNISQKQHIFTHAESIVIRKFVPSPKHHKKPYYRGGVIVSQMDISNEIAQEVLNKSTLVDGRLYGSLNDKIYEFRRTIGHYYHGFDVTESINCDLKNRIIAEVNHNSDLL